MKIEVIGNYIIITRDIGGVTKTFEYPLSCSFYFTRFGTGGLESIEIINTVSDGKTFVTISDINQGLILDADNLPYTVQGLTTLLQENTGAFMGNNVKLTA